MELHISDSGSGEGVADSGVTGGQGSRLDVRPGE